MALTQISTQGIKDGTITGSDLATNVDLVDNQKLRLGTGNDLQIFHTGTASKINNANVPLLFQSDAMSFHGEGGSETMAVFTKNGAVELYHDNSKKFATTSIGVNIFGRVAPNEFQISDNEKAFFGTGNDLEIYHDGTDSFIDNSTGNLKIIAPNNVEAIKVFKDGTVNIGGNADNVRLRFGIGSDLQIYHDGSHSYALNTTGNLFLGSNSSVDIGDGDFTEYAARFIHDGGVELYHNNSKKFDTTTYGVKVTGRLAATTSITGADNVQIKLGDGDDLQIFSSGSIGHIKSANDDLRIETPRFNVLNQAATETMIDAYQNGAVELYHNNSKKFETNSTGCFVAGSLGVNPSSSGNLDVNKEGTGTLINLRTTGTARGNISSNGSTVQFNTSASDKSLKKNFENWTENTLALFKNINAQKFNYLDQEDGVEKEKGFIAQDMVVSFPEAYQKNDDDKYMFNPSGMVVYLMKAIQELEAEVASLKAS